jgi:hypothetical protein
MILKIQLREVMKKNDVSHFVFTRETFFCCPSQLPGKEKLEISIFVRRHVTERRGFLSSCFDSKDVFTPVGWLTGVL